MSLYVGKPVQRVIKEIALDNDCRPHDVLIEAVDLVLEKYGREPEPLVQFSLELRRSLRKQLDRLASDSDMTMRAFVLDALKAKGLAVDDDDLVDQRKSFTRKSMGE